MKQHNTFILKDFIIRAIIAYFPPFPRAFVARTQIYNQTQIHQNSSVPLDIIV